MKKKILMALLAGLCLTMTGCSQKTGETEAPTQKTETNVQTEAVTEKTSGTEDRKADSTENESESAGKTNAESEGETEKNGSDSVKTEEPDYKALNFVTLGQYKGLEVTVSSMDVTEKDIQDQYFMDCNSHDKLEKVLKGTVADGDVTNIDYVGTVDGEEFNGGTDKGVDLTIGSGRFVPGFEEGLIGAAIGEKVDVTVTFPENYEESLAGKEAVFAVTVNHVKKTPEMNDKLVAEISDKKNVNEYRAELEKQIKANKESIRESEVINGVLNLVYSGATINGYPEDVVDYRVDQVKSYYKDIAEKSKMKLEEFLQQQFQLSEEEFDEQYPTFVKQSMVQEMLLKAVAESEKLEITDEDYESGLDKYVASTGAESKETLLSIYSETQIRKSMLMDKTLDFLKENTTVKESENTSEAATEAGTEAASEAETKTAGTETEETKAEEKESETKATKSATEENSEKETN